MENVILIFEPSKEPYYMAHFPVIASLPMGTYIKDITDNSWYARTMTMKYFDYLTVIYESDVPKHILGLTLLY